jgi:D-serine deaminase-like pyridoxal phosphate-dependent protein
MREARVAQRAIPQLQAALEANEITLYRAGEIAKLPAGQQEIAVAQWVTRSLLQTQGQAIAAAVIREELTRRRALCGAKVDLDRVASAIKKAIIDFDC